MNRIAVFGAGVIGRGWAIIFARPRASHLGPRLSASAKGAQFPWRWGGGTISPNLDAVRRMSDNDRYCVPT